MKWVVLMAKIDRKICETAIDCPENASCIDICPLHIIRNINNMIIIGTLCVDCGECVQICPKKAIYI